MRLKKTLLMLFFVLAGAVLGALVASLCAEVPGLAWLAFSRSVGFSPEAPLVLDLSVATLVFGLRVHLSVAQVFTIGIAAFLCTLITRRWK